MISWWIAVLAFAAGAFFGMMLFAIISANRED